MASRPISITRAVELSSRMVRNNEENADPMIELILGLTDDKGDAMQSAIRAAVLQSLYCQTEDFRMHFRAYIGEDVAGVIESTASLS